MFCLILVSDERGLSICFSRIKSLDDASKLYPFIPVPPHVRLYPLFMGGRENLPENNWEDGKRGSENSQPPVSKQPPAHLHHRFMVHDRDDCFSFGGFYMHLHGQRSYSVMLWKMLGCTADFLVVCIVQTILICHKLKQRTINI